MLRRYIREAVRFALQIGFAKKRFKILLRSTNEHFDQRARALAAVTGFFSTAVKPIRVNAPFGRSVLVIAPHQDDEVIGCGGALALQLLAGGHAEIVILQDGADEHQQVGLSRAALRDLRNAESMAAARVVGAGEPVFFGACDLGEERGELAGRLLEIMNEAAIDTVFTPFVLDEHSDHRACNLILCDALRKFTRPVRVLGYEVWAHCLPNVAVVIDGVIDKKRQMLGCFEFANSANDYLNSTIGLNMFNSRQLPAGTGKFVECFFELPKQEFIDLVQAVDNSDRRAQVNVGLPNPQAAR